MAGTKSIFKSGSKTRRIPILETRNFPGLQSFPKPQQLQRGAAQASRNFLTRGTWVELRPGYHALGTEVAGSGKTLGIFTAHKWDGSEIIFKATADGKLKWYDPNNISGQGGVDGWSEVGGAGANLLSGAVATGENVYLDEYISPAGTQLWVSSPSTDLIKIMTANPASWLSQYNSSKNFKGRIRIIQNSLFLWHYKAALSAGSNSTLQRSYVDSENYTTQTDNALALTQPGNNSVQGTLTKNSVAKATVFALQFTYTDVGGYSETFTDDYLGNLTGSNGSTGTIDYSTGIFVLKLKASAITVNTPVVNCVYSYEDSTNGGIADFTKSGTRAAGQGIAWLQNKGGDILAVNPYNGSYYVLHQHNAWIVTPSADDSTSSNLIYREELALSSERGSYATQDGIYYIDDSGRNVMDQNQVSKPHISLIEYNVFAQQVLPIDISSGIIDLTSYVFDQCKAIQALDWILFFCRTSDSNQNNRVIVYNYKLSSDKLRIFDILDYFANDACVYGAQLIGGDSVSNNAFKLFDNFDDDNGIINASWVGNQDDHGIEGLKQTKKLWIEGFIGTIQKVDVYIQLDAGNPQKIGTISGSGPYVDAGQAVTIGSLEIGVYPAGNMQPVGFHYLAEFIVNTAKYKYFTIAFVPTNIGYFSFQMYANYDIRLNVDKLPRKYRAQRSFTSGNLSGGGGTISIPGSIYVETPLGVIDGVNTTYTTTRTITTVLNFYINGEEIDPGAYTITGNAIVFITPLSKFLANTPYKIIYV